MSPDLEPIQISSLLHEVSGQWVAFHNGEIVEARRTLDELLMALSERGVSDVTVVRAPREGESELVGLG